MKIAVFIACMLVSTKQLVHTGRNNLLLMLSQLTGFTYFMTNLKSYSDVYIVILIL